MPNHHILFDGDVLLYKAAFAVEIKYDTVLRDGHTHSFMRPEDTAEFLSYLALMGESYTLGYDYLAHIDDAKDAVSQIIFGACSAYDTNNFTIILSDPVRENIFRYQLYPEYKANRKGRKPKILSELRELTANGYFGNAEVAEGIEADDLLGIKLTAMGGEAICASIDKDLLQVPGRHYNLNSKAELIVSDLGTLTLVNNKNLTGTGKLWMYAQMLMGDSVDNIPGAKGYGPVATYAALKDCKSDTEAGAVIANVFSIPQKLSLDLTRSLVEILREPK